MSALKDKMIQQMQLKGYSCKTIKVYTDCISMIAIYYNTPPDLISTEQIRDYLQHRLNVEGISKSWMNQFISAFKILNTEILKKEWNNLNIPRPRRQKKLPVVLSKEEVTRIIQANTNIKHRIIMMLCYSAGLRLGEISHLKIGDVDSKRMMLRIQQAKGFKDRYCVLSPVILEALREYWKIYRPKIWLFETKPGKPTAHKTIQHVFKNSLRKAGINKKVGIHSLRHSYATHLLEQGVNLPLIQQLMGHKSLKTTSIYLHVQQYSIDAVKSPLDSLSL